MLRIFSALPWTTSCLSCCWTQKVIPLFQLVWAGRTVAVRSLVPRHNGLPAAPPWGMPFLLRGTDDDVWSLYSPPSSVGPAVCSHLVWGTSVSFCVPVYDFQFPWKISSGCRYFHYLTSKIWNHAILNIMWLSSICTKVIYCNYDLTSAVWFQLLFIFH